MPRTTSAVLFAIALLAAAGCSSLGDASGKAPGGAATTTAATTTSIVPFAGPGDFYDVPDPLEPGDPGSLIRYESFGPAIDGRTVWRVMYHSRDAQDRDVAVTGVVAVPTGDAPEGGWSTLSWGHGSSGLAPECAPSRRDDPELPAFGTDGIVATSDYVGLGPNGQRHAYLSGESEGHSMIDIVRAAGQLPGVEASPDWTSVGVSQGGHAALFAGELAEEYAPELDLHGVVAMAPASELDRSFPDDSPQLTSLIRVLAIYGLAVDHPEVHPEDFASPEVQSKSSELDKGCMQHIGAVFATMPVEDFWTVHPLDTEVGRRISKEISPGHQKTDAPIFLLQGDQDTLVVPARTEALFDRLCENGDVVDLEMVPGAGHDGVITDDVRATVGAWVDARLEGDPASTGCD